MPIRVLIYGMPRLLTEVVSEVVASEPDTVVVPCVGAAAEPLVTLRVLQPDVVILQQEGESGRKDRASLLEARDGLKVVALIGGGVRVMLYRKGAEAITLQSPSMAGLLRAVRCGGPPCRGGPRRRRCPKLSGR